MKTDNQTFTLAKLATEVAAKRLKRGDTILTENRETNTTKPFKIIAVLDYGPAFSHLTLLDGIDPVGITIPRNERVMKLKKGVDFIAIKGRSLESR